MRKNKALIPQYFDFNFVYKFLSNKKVLACGKWQSRAVQDFAMSDFSLTLVLQIKTSINRNKTWQRYK